MAARRLTLIEVLDLVPGTPEAIAAGCRCTGQATGDPRPGRGYVWALKCPFHGDDPDEPNRPIDHPGAGNGPPANRNN